MKIWRKFAVGVLTVSIAVMLLTGCGGSSAGGSAGGGNINGNGGNTTTGGSTDTGNKEPDNSDNTGGNSSDNDTGKNDDVDDDKNNDNNNGSDNESGFIFEETVSYDDSRTGKFFNNIGKVFTMKIYLMDRLYGGISDSFLISTDGNRYYKETQGYSRHIYSDGSIKYEMDDGALITLEDASQKKKWDIYREGQTYYLRGDITYNVEAVDWSNLMLSKGMEMKKGKYKSYYAEAQLLTYGNEDLGYIYCYEGGSGVPKYIIKRYMDSGYVKTETIEIGQFSKKADTELLNFEKLLENCKDVS